MEDPRRSGVYLERLRRWFSSTLDGSWWRNLMRSGMLTGLFLGLLVIGLLIAYRERGRGHLHKLEEKIVSTEHHEAPVPQPGGQEALVLTRTRMAGSSSPEFLSVTMLPGRGMNVLQISAYLPDKGEVNLLASPTLEDIEATLSGRDADVNGAASLNAGGAIELPWAGRLLGTPSQGRVLTSWRNHTLSAPEFSAGTPTVARGGLLLNTPSSSADTSAMPDGGQAQASFQATDFGAHWPSNTDVEVTVLLSSRSIEMTVVTRNAGQTAEPVGIGWHPRFAVLDHHREQLRLHLPGQMRIEVHDRQSGQPTGTLLPVARTPYDFTARGGVKLGNVDLDDSFVQLHQEFLDSGPVAELDDAANRYGLRLTALSGAIKAMHVDARADDNFVAISPRYNYDDPFGHEWTRETDTGMVVLQPGQSTQWKVRLELIPLGTTQSTL